MSLQINPQNKITMLDLDFVQIINNIIRKSSANISNGVILNFRDPDYCAEKGGFHPVELSISPSGDLLYLTDFSFAGKPPFRELGVQLEWNFEQETFRQFDSFYDLECGRGLLGLYTKNFVAYHRSGVYEVEVTSI